MSPCFWFQLAVPLLVCLSAGLTSAAEPVQVQYATGSAEVSKLAEGGRFYTDKDDLAFRSLPKEVRGLSFTSRKISESNTDLTVDVPAGTVCVLITGASSPDSEKAAYAAGWRWFAKANVTGGNVNWEFEFYVRPAGKAVRAVIPSHGNNQVAIAASSLSVVGTKKPNGPDGNKAAAVDTPPPDMHPDGRRDTKPIEGAPSVDVALPQTSIHALEVLQPGGGMIALGQTSELILTVTSDPKPHRLAVRFVTPIGPHMRLARDDAERFVALIHPNWNASQAELSFEDKYDDHDGGSLGAAVATLMMSATEGFKIDPAVAMTGDISANGKVRAIGEVAAKLRGAAAGHCALVVMPTDNFDQLVDAVTYAGPTIATDVQVFGAATLADATAIARVDRDPALTAAIQKFDAIAAAVKKSPAYLKRPEAVAALTSVLEGAPNHLSAKCLLAVANGTAPKTLSLAASRYYAFNAFESMFDAVDERSKLAEKPRGPSPVIRQGQANLRKLRPLSDPAARPLIDVLAGYIEAADAYVNGNGSKTNMERRRQALLDELSKEQADSDTMQKLLHQGM